MGLCRVLVYVTAALAVGGRVGAAVAGGSLVLLFYLIGLTYVAKQENLTVLGDLWPLAFLSAPFLYAWPALLMPGLTTRPLPGLPGLGRLRGGRPRPPGTPRHPARGREPDRRHLAARRAPHRRRRRPVPSGLAVLGFVLTLAFQRWVPGT